MTISSRRQPWSELVQRALLPLVRRRFHLVVLARTDLAALPAPCIFAANHGSHLDSLAVLAALPTAARQRTRIAAAADYWYRSPARRAAAALLNAFPFPRHGAVGLRRSAALLASGQSVLLYPAGTRDKGCAFRRGVGFLATRTGYPVVPVAILGAAAIWPKGQPFPGRGRLTVVFGEPLVCAPDEPVDEVTARIAAAVHSLIGEAAGEVPQPGRRLPARWFAGGY
ncbi:MAG: lysophospholipid acyltransferase family protein [Thermomicrobiales bacterium]